MLGMPHLHVEGLGHCPDMVDGNKSIGMEDLRLLTEAWCLGAGEGPTIPSGTSKAFSSTEDQTTLIAPRSYVLMFLKLLMMPEIFQLHPSNDFVLY